MGGLTNDRPETDHVISGPMRRKTASDDANKHTNKHTNRETVGHRDSMAEPAQLGRFSENSLVQSLK